MARHSHVVSCYAKPTGCPTSSPTKQHCQEIISSFPIKNAGPPTFPIAEVGFCTFVRNLMLKNGMSTHIAQYCTDNWRSNTIRNYQYKLFDWMDFNKHVNQDPYKFSGKKVMDFLVYLFESKNKSASSVRAAYLVTRSLCNAAGCQLTRSFHKQIVMLLNGMYSRRPGVPRPRKDHIWDVSIVLDFLGKWQTDQKLSLLRLGAKLACLIMLTTMHRRIDLCQLDVKMIS